MSLCYVLAASTLSKYIKNGFYIFQITTQSARGKESVNMASASYITVQQITRGHSVLPLGGVRLLGVCINHGALCWYKNPPFSFSLRETDLYVLKITHRELDIGKSSLPTTPLVGFESPLLWRSSSAWPLRTLLHLSPVGCIQNNGCALGYL